MREGLAVQGITVDSVLTEITPGSAGGPANVVATSTTTVKTISKGRPVTLHMRFGFLDARAAVKPLRGITPPWRERKSRGRLCGHDLAGRIE